MFFGCQEESMLYAFLSDIGMWASVPIMARRRGMAELEDILKGRGKVCSYTFQKVYKDAWKCSPYSWSDFQNFPPERRIHN